MKLRLKEDSLGLTDQWRDQHNLQSINRRSALVLVASGKNSSEEGLKLGQQIYQALGNERAASRGYLKSLSAPEIIVVPLALLPSAPKIFWKLFEKGFQKEAESEVLFDFGLKFSAAFGLKELSTDPYCLFFPKDFLRPEVDLEIEERALNGKLLEFDFPKQLEQCLKENRAALFFSSLG